jgi:hypothetical protein
VDVSHFIVEAHVCTCAALVLSCDTPYPGLNFCSHWHIYHSGFRHLSKLQFIIELVVDRVGNDGTVGPNWTF